MSIELTISKPAKRGIWTRLFIVVLGLQAILELGVGAALLFSFPTALESGFGITYSKDLDILGIALGLYLLLLTALIILSIFWVTKRNYAGVIIGIIVGAFLLIFGLATFFKFGEMQGILIDSLRGLLTIIIGYMAGKELGKR